MQTMLIQKAEISAAAAHAVAGQALTYAAEHGYNVNVAVVNGSGILLAFVRMNQAPLHSIDIAIDKAYSAASFGKKTSAWAADLKNHSPAVQEGLVQRPRFIAFGGGVPILLDGQLVGAVGVSGATEDQDEAVAQAGIAVLTQHK